MLIGLLGWIAFLFLFIAAFAGDADAFSIFLGFGFGVFSARFLLFLEKGVE